MKNKPKIAVLGGDMRQYAVAKELSKRNLSIYTYGLAADVRDDAQLCDSQRIEDAVFGADAVILPLPAGTDTNLLNCSAIKNSERVPLETVVQHMNERAVLFGGKIPEGIVTRAESRGITVVDYFLFERLQIKNAYITAEAAVSIAMNSLDKCIKDSKTAITGTGRISRLLAELLCSMGADVCVTGRNTDTLAYFELMGCKTVLISGLDWYNEFLRGYDIIFNTVPTWLFDKKFLENVDKDTLIIELASAPGGVDICAARELSSNILWGASLPGKYAPHSAGSLIAECICDGLRKEGIL